MKGGINRGINGGIIGDVSYGKKNCINGEINIGINGGFQ